MENKLIFAKEIIKEAGAFIKESLSKTITVEEKTAYDDLVTNIDKQTQDLLVARIKSAFPSDNIFAEENGLVHNIKDGNVWVLDPIDGTVNFIVQQDNFCVMIAYYEEGKENLVSFITSWLINFSMVVASLMCIAMTNCFQPIKVAH